MVVELEVAAVVGWVAEEAAKNSERERLLGSSGLMVDDDDAAAV